MTKASGLEGFLSSVLGQVEADHVIHSVGFLNQKMERDLSWQELHRSMLLQRNVGLELEQADPLVAAKVVLELSLRLFSTNPGLATAVATAIDALKSGVMGVSVGGADE